MISYNEDEKRKIIMDYYMNKRNRVDKFENQNYQFKYLHSSSCVDEITLFYNGNKNDFKMVSQGCAVFLSASEIFIERLLELGWDKKDILIDSFFKLVEKKEISNEERKILGKLNIYENVSKHLNRKECALMIANIIKSI